MVDVEIRLISHTTAQDANGVTRKVSEISRDRLAKVESVGRNEFFAGGKTGFRPALKFVLFAQEWSGERELEYNGARYAIYRTYQIPGSDYMELWTQRKGGVNGRTDTDSH